MCENCVTPLQAFIPVLYLLFSNENKKSILFFLPKFWLRIHANMKKPAYLINKRHSSFFLNKCASVPLENWQHNSTKYIILRTHLWKPVVKGITELRKKGFSFLTDEPSSFHYFLGAFCNNQGQILYVGREAMLMTFSLLQGSPTWICTDLSWWGGGLLTWTRDVVWLLKEPFGGS